MKMIENVVKCFDGSGRKFGIIWMLVVLLSTQSRNEISAM